MFKPDLGMGNSNLVFRTRFYILLMFQLVLKYINVTYKEDLRSFHGLRVRSGAAIMRKHMNPPKMFVI